MIRRKPAVVVLGTDGDFQRFLHQVNPIFAVQLDRAGVHFAQPLQRRRQQRLGTHQVGPGFLAQIFEPVSRGIISEIEIDPPPLEHRFDVDQNVHNRGTARHLAAVERPLVPLEKNHRIHLPDRIEIVAEKFDLRPLPPGIAADEFRDHLHVGSGYIPAELRGGQPILRFRQTLRPRTGPQGHPDPPRMHRRINTRLIQPARPPCGEHHILRRV